VPEKTVVEFGDLVVPITSTDRVVFPAAGITKGDVIAYYADVAPVALPELRGRPLTVLREKVGVEPPEEGPISVARSDGPHELARAGLLELGYEPGEADRLLSGVEGETAEEILANALRAARL